jgi:hypothetical protein
MNRTEEDKTVLNPIETEPKSQIIKAKKKKKKAKKVKKEKKCSGLRELLDQITEEKLEKNKKEQEKKEEKKEKKNKKTKEIKFKIEINKKEEPSTSPNILSPLENEDKNKDNQAKDHNNIFNSSVSGTTVATLSYEDFNEFQKFNYDKYSDGPNKCEYNDLRPNFLLKNLETSEDEKNEDILQIRVKRKKSSPIFDYYDGFDKILSETHKGSVDLENSLNFIKKNEFISSNISMKNCHSSKNNNKLNILKNFGNINKININNNDNNISNNNKIINDNNIDNNKDNIINNDNYIENKYNNDDLNILNQIDNNNHMNDYYYMNYSYYPYMDYFDMMPESINSKYNINNMGNIVFYNKKKNKHYHQKNKKEKNELNCMNKNKKDISLSVRDGDWLCQMCFNLNFSFRSFCNRCKAPK